MKIIKRRVENLVIRALKVFPAVYVNGPRQAGKTTLVQKSLQFKGKFITFDNPIEYAQALRNPQEYLREAGCPLIIDEVQMVPDLFYPLKMMIDQQRLENLEEDKEKPNGRYLLTGSANLMIIPKLAHAMVGRMGTITLLPLSASEYWQGKGDFIECVFTKDFNHFTRDEHSIAQAIRVATFPGLIGLDHEFVQNWVQNYVRKITIEDPQHSYKLEKPEYMPLLLETLATRAGSLINDADISRDIGLSSITTRLYRSLLNGTFITTSLRPWYRNINKRLVKAGKIYFYDTLLLSYLLGSTPEDIARVNPARFGHILENFVLTEILKLKNNTNSNIKVTFYRTRDGKEVDFVLENTMGQVVGIEVKYSEHIGEKDFSGLKELQSVTGKDFICGIILCNVPRVMSYGNNMYLVPISALWS